MRPVIAFFAFSTALFTCTHAFSQAVPAPAAAAFPQTKAYVSFIVPWVTINKNATTTEFQTATTIGFPIGILVYSSKSFGFCYELTPSVQWQKTPGKPGTSKTNDVLFDPGPVFRFKHSISFIARLAFDTQGRYGFTPVFNKVYLKTKAASYWFSLSSPVRFGNGQLASIGGSLQIGLTFN